MVVLLEHVTRILGADLQVSALNLDSILYYRSQRQAEQPPRYPDSKVAIATINREISVFKTMLKRAVIYGRIESNPIDKAPMLKEDNVRERVLTDEEFERLLEYSPDYLKPIYITAFYEPMRRAEILELHWSEIDIKSVPGFIRLSTKRTKGKKSGRVIPLHPRVKEAYTSYPVVSKVIVCF